MSIIITVASIFADMERALWSIMSIYATTQVIDKILTGGITEKIVHIVSNKTKEIGDDIHQQLNRGGTILTGQDLTNQQDKKILFVVVDKRQIPSLKKLVLNKDKNALMIVMEAYEMMGTSRLY